MLDIPTTTIVAGAAAVCFVVYIIEASKDSTAWKSPPESLSWIGLRNEWFSKYRTCMRDWKNGPDVMKESYEKASTESLTAIYSKQDKPVATCNFTFIPEVQLPQAWVTWMVHQPDNVLYNKIITDHLLSLKYTAPTKATYQNRFHEDVLRRDLTRHLGDVTTDLSEELMAGLEEEWGTDTETFKEVTVYKSLQEVILRAFTRAFVGQKLAQEPKFRRAIKSWGHSLAMSANLILVFLPKFIQPLLAPMVALPSTLALWRVNSYLLPLIKSRLQSMRQALEDEASLNQDSESRDLLYWLIRHAMMHESPAELEPKNIAGRLNICNFAALHTTSINLTNAMFNLCSGPDATSWIEALRDEARTVLAAHRGHWSRAAVAELFMADSAIKETLRHPGMAGRGLARQVMKVEGLKLPDGTHLQRGVRVSIPIGPIHADEKFYENAKSFQPFRFAEMRRQPNLHGFDDVDQSEVDHERENEKEDLAKKRSSLGLVTPSDTFLAWGLGKHACPGRWFAAHELKLLLASIVLHYEIGVLDERPVTKFISDTPLPPFGGKLKVRRRKKDE